MRRIFIARRHHVVVDRERLRRRRRTGAPSRSPTDPGSPGRSRTCIAERNAGRSCSAAMSNCFAIVARPFAPPIRHRARSARRCRAACRRCTIAWAISGWSVSIPSSFCGATLSPLSLTMMSFLRSVMTIRPLSSRWPMSPVCSQPSRIAACGVFRVAASSRASPARRAPGFRHPRRSSLRPRAAAGRPCPA